MRKNLTWEHRKNIMNKNDIVQMREISLRAKDVVVSNSGKEKSLGSETYWKGLDMNIDFSRPWGPGTMYELAIPLALYMGCSKIVTIGWDLFKNTINSGQKQDDWFYDNIEYQNTKTLAGLKEHLMVAKRTKGLYEYLEKQDVELVIVDPDGDNPAYNKIKRLKDIDEIK